jgi:hypothetical protein
MISSGRKLLRGIPLPLPDPAPSLTSAWTGSAGEGHAAIYARVSTVDGRQDPETQLRQLREHAERRGFPVAHKYVDHASGAKNDRAEYRAMLEAARRRRFDVLLVWRYDRFARSMRELVNVLSEFDSMGIDFISYNEGADTTTPRASSSSASWQARASSDGRGVRLDLATPRIGLRQPRISLLRRPISTTWSPASN